MEPEVSVKDVLTTSYVGVSESDSVRGAVELMRTERAGSVLVVRGSSAIGIMTEWDVLGVVEDGTDPSTVTVGSVMSSPVISIPPDHSLTDAADVMARDEIRNLVVEDGDGIVGVLTQRDVITAAGSFTGATAIDEAELRTMATPESGAVQAAANGGTEYTTQSICEVCGSLADSLWERNGQLVCTDCRSV
ncbi:putative signal-transduction protein containing cAMP-binding and CBS domains [Halovivax ruber XH-70]|uniref:Putative signal-transduction protein containing cAMP-binding and CBS domains n=1 Tax=Halovivax ruber (strain DSM 18193 / JCM 13892 / XH-70) TaxID=797302 RepID=L0IBG5_HALRX|nr:CBS domain-containing protein [Halovivax ruber]AGB16163.1 putative signal-transduction protein containing cAMP-binding and CBS domains [Halovivax ruber XH-70]